MSVFGHVCMHSFSCQPPFFHHIPFKRKSNIFKSEWPAIPITTKFYSSQVESLTFSYVSAGSPLLPLHSPLPSSLARKHFHLFDSPLLKICYDLCNVIPIYFKKVLQNTRKHAKCKQRIKRLKYQNLLTKVSYVFVVLAILFGPLSASSLDPDNDIDGRILALAKRDTDYLRKPLTYPNCSEDFDCPEDQVCKFLHRKKSSTTLVVIQEPQVLPHSKVYNIFR